MGIIYTRAYSLSLDRYESFKGYQITSRPMGHLHKESLKLLTVNEVAILLIPFIDNCNHKSTSKHPLGESYNFNSLTRKGEIDMSIHQKIHKGEEYAYTYSPNMSNEKFVYRYGFFLKNNPNAATNIIIPLQKKDFSRRKNEICKIMRCFDQSFDELYTHNQVEKFSLFINIGRYEIAKRILDALRLYALPESKIDNFEDIINRLSYNHWLDYNSEMKALAYFRDNVLVTIDSKKISYV